MSTNQLRVAGAALFYLIIFVSGFWLTRSGKPYNQILYNVHKLIALIAVILFAVTLYRANRVAALNAVEVIASVVTGLFFLGLFVTGALVSIDRPMPAAVFKLHHVVPYLAVISTAATLYLLVGKR
ncbi:MAG: hypothetical protein JXA89_07325 [Anaerolineae bacterium]|nr:hypothetical protein [Anaerolineae bacterium]